MRATNAACIHAATRKRIALTVIELTAARATIFAFAVQLRLKHTPCLGAVHSKGLAITVSQPAHVRRQRWDLQGAQACVQGRCRGGNGVYVLQRRRRG